MSAIDENVPGCWSTYAELGKCGGSGDYHLQAASPCVNAGNNAAIDWDWDLEWHRYEKGEKKGHPKETPDQMVQKVKDFIDGEITTKTEDKLIILMHDTMFKTSDNNKEKLEKFVRGLKELTGKYTVTFKKIDEY